MISDATRLFIRRFSVVDLCCRSGDSFASDGGEPGTGCEGFIGVRSPEDLLPGCELLKNQEAHACVGGVECDGKAIEWLFVLTEQFDIP